MQKPTEKQRKLVAAVTSGATFKEAGRLAGYAESTLATEKKDILSSPAIRHVVAEFHENIDMKPFYETHKQLRKARKTIYHKGEKVAREWDNEARAKAVDMAYKATGLYADSERTTPINVNIIAPGSVTPVDVEVEPEGEE